MIVVIGVLFFVLIVGTNVVLAQSSNRSTNVSSNGTNTNSIPHNVIRTPEGGWITATTKDENGKNLTIHVESGVTQFPNGNNIPVPPSFPILSPLKQFQSGIPAPDVICKDGYVLVIKSSNGNPYCVRPTTEQRLLVKGWITPERFLALHTTQNKSEDTHASINNHNKTQNILVDKKNNDTMHQQILFSESNGTVPVTNVTGSPLILSPGISEPTISSTKAGIKIISIQMSPNPLKVGDYPRFTANWQNISDKTVYQTVGCTATPLGLTISPSDNIQIIPPGHLRTCAVQTHAPVYPGQNDTSIAGLNPIHPYNANDRYTSYALEYYQITKPGVLNMTMTLKLQKDARDSWDLINEIHFSVNVIQ